MMGAVRSIMSRMPLKWKLTIGAAVFISVLFIVFNLLQSYVLEQWLIHQEIIQIKNNLNQITGYFQDSHIDSKTSIIRSKGYLGKLNADNQLIRILDRHGSPILTLKNTFHTDWVNPKIVQHRELTQLRHENDHVLVIRAPFPGKKFQGTIEIARNLENNDQLIKMILLVLLMGCMGSIVLSGFAGMWVARSMLKSLQSLRDTMRAVQRQGLQMRADVNPNGDEISQITHIFNEMMDQVEQTFIKQRQFVEDASHELRTPLSILEGHLSVLDRWGKHDPEIMNESLKISRQEVSRLRHLVSELLHLSRADREEAQPDHPVEAIELAPCVREVVKHFQSVHPDFRFNLDLAAIEDAKAAVDPAHWEQILIILLDNAVKYSGRRREAEITGKQKERRICLELRDYGVGIPAADLPLVFERFYRVDKARTRELGGSGLGLSIAKRLVERFGGRIRIESVEGEGTRVLVSFPARN